MVLFFDISNMTSKYGTNILLLYAITNEKTEINADRQDACHLQDLPCENTFQ